MPWEHCGATIADDQPCACGITKAQWTVEFQVTRQFRVTRRHVLRIVVLDPAEVPVPGAAFRVRWPDGRTEEGTLDDMGTAKLPGPAEGRCVVTFPGHDRESLHVERGGEAEPVDAAGTTAVASTGGGPSEGGTRRVMCKAGPHAPTHGETWRRPRRARSARVVASFGCEATATLRLRTGHWFEVALVDPDGTPRAGVPVTLHLPDGSTRPGTTDDAGLARWVGVPHGPVRYSVPKGPLRNPRWSADAARSGETVELSVATTLPAGTEVAFSVLEHDAGRHHDELAHLTTTVQDGAARVSWEVGSLEHAREPVARHAGARLHHPPDLVFRASALGHIVQSAPLPLREWFEFELRGRGGDPRTGVECTLHLHDGTTRTATTNDEGVARWDDLPPGAVSVEYPKEGAGLRLSLVDGAGAPVADEAYRVERDGALVSEGTLDAAGESRVALGAGEACTVTFSGRARGALSRVASAETGAGTDTAAGDLRAGPVVPRDAEGHATFEVEGAGELRLRVGPLSNARWGEARARFHDPVTMTVDCPGLADGEWVIFDVFEHDADGQHDPVVRLASRASGGSATFVWHMPDVTDEDDEPTEIDRATGFATPELGFVARYGDASARCPDLLVLSTDLVLPLRDEAGEPLADVAYELRCGDEVKRGRTDAQGVLRETGVGPDFTLRLEDGEVVHVGLVEVAAT